MTIGATPEIGILRQAVQQRYTELAGDPGRTFHFHHGRSLALMLGYPAERVDAMPHRAVESFAGVGNPLALGPVEQGETVLDVGSGSGFDCFVAAGAVGSSGRVIGIDITPSMIEKAQATARRMSLQNVEFREGLAEEMPLEPRSVDVAISNGVINLCLDKQRVFGEIFRVLKPGGRLYLSDIVVHQPVPDAARANVDLWTA